MENITYLGYNHAKKCNDFETKVAYKWIYVD